MHIKIMCYWGYSNDGGKYLGLSYLSEDNEYY